MLNDLMRCASVPHKSANFRSFANMTPQGMNSIFPRRNGNIWSEVWRNMERHRLNDRQSRNLSKRIARQLPRRRKGLVLAIVIGRINCNKYITEHQSLLFIRPNYRSGPRLSH